MAIDIITTIVTPAASYDLTDLKTVKEELGITNGDNDSRLKRWITEESAHIARDCSRVFALETVSDMVYLRGRPFQPSYRDTPVGQPKPIQLTRWPVASIASLIETYADGTTATLVQDTDFKLDPKYGWLFRLDDTSGMLRSWFASVVTVQYEAGYDFDDPPPDALPLRQACLILIKHRLSAASRDPMLRSEETVGVERMEYWVGATGYSGDLPPEVEAILAQYRVPAS